MKFGKEILRAAEVSASVVALDDWMDYKSLKKMIKDMPKPPEAEADAGTGAGAGTEGEPERSPSAPAAPAAAVAPAASASPAPDAAAGEAAPATAAPRRPALDAAQLAHRLGSREEERAFFRSLLHELEKVSRRYAGLLQDAVERTERSLAEEDAASNRDKAVRVLTETHMFLLLVENYAILNYCGFRKILKKHDKMLVTTVKDLYMARMVNSKNFANVAPLQSALERVERRFIALTDAANAAEGAGVGVGVGGGAGVGVGAAAAAAGAPEQPPAPRPGEAGSPVPVPAPRDRRVPTPTRVRTESDADLVRRHDEMALINKQSLDRLKSLAEAAVTLAAAGTPSPPPAPAPPSAAPVAPVAPVPVVAAARPADLAKRRRVALSPTS